jgi:replication initiation protein RepC
VSERSLSVLNALLTFHPETARQEDDRIVFPSNDKLTLRAHGMPASTLLPPRRSGRRWIDHSA